MKSDDNILDILQLVKERLLHFNMRGRLYLSNYTYDNFSEISYHDHSGAFELSVVICGHGYHYINDTLYEVSAGDAIFLGPASRHSLFSVDKENSTGLTVVNCVFSRSIFKQMEALFPKLREAFEYLSSESAQRPLRRNGNYLGQGLSEYCRPLIIHIERLFKQDWEGYLDSILLTLSAILLEIYRAFPEVNPPMDHQQIPALVKQAMALIDSHYLDANFSVSQIYSTLYVSKSHLCELFRRYTDTTPVRYLNTLRIQEARAILRDEADCGKDLFARVGYHEYNTFYVNFKKYTGFNLRDYIKALRVFTIRQ